MGSKGPDVVIERRLRPIYDCIDSGNHKKAIQEAERVLKKHPAAESAAKGLKALALVRSSRVNEAWSLIENLEKLGINEDHALQALTYCFKDLGRPDKIASLYEGVCKRCPQNEELLSHLFMAYVRVRDFKNQQKTAQELYRLTKKSMYYFWSIMSTFMQAMEDPNKASLLYYPLAENMIKKFIKEEKIQTESEVVLYLMILQEQKKHSDVLDLIQESAVGCKHLKCLWNRDSLLIDALKALENWDEIFDLCSRTLPSRSDDWELYMALFQSTFVLAGKTDKAEKSELIQKTTDIVLDLIEADRDGRTTRGPYLARLQWIMGLLERECVVRAELGEPLNLLIEYFRLFSQKPCCFSDMRPYLCLLGEQQRDEFLDSICGIAGLPYEETPDDSTHSFAETPNALQRHVCCLQLGRCLGKHADWSTEKKQLFAVGCLRRYKDALKLGRNLKSSEFQYGDPYSLTALHVLWDVYQERADSALLNQMVLVAESGLGQSPSNFHLQYILSRLYALLGAGKCVLSVTVDMALKHIQKDTIGYLVFDQLGPFGLFQDLYEWLNDLESFFAQTVKDANEGLVNSYKIGSFSKIGEIIGFDDKLQLSFQRVSGRIMRQHVWMLKYCDSLESLSDLLGTAQLLNFHTDYIEWNKLNDNRDFSCHPCWDPGTIEQDREEERKKSFQEFLDMMKFRHLVLRVLSGLSLAVNCAKTVDESEKEMTEEKLLDNLRTLLSQLKAHYRHCRNNHSDSMAGSLQGPLPTQFNVYLQGGYFEILICFLESAYCIMGQKRSNGDAPTVKEDESPDRLRTLPSVEELQALFRRMVSSHQLGTGTPGDSKGPPRFPHMQLVHLSYLLQTVGVSLLVAMICWESAVGSKCKPRQTTSGKKSKKKQQAKIPADLMLNGSSSGSETESILTGQCRDVISVLCQVPISIRRMVEDLCAVLNTAELYTLTLGDNSENDKSELRSEVWKKLKGSYNSSLQEMLAIIDHQEKLASGLAITAK